MKQTYVYRPDEFVECGIAGDALLEITALIQSEERSDRYNDPRYSVSIMLATLEFRNPMGERTKVNVTHKCQGEAYEQEILKSYLRAYERDWDGPDAA